MKLKENRPAPWDEGVPAVFDPATGRMAGETIVCFGWTDWDTAPQTWNQVLGRLAYRNRVLFVLPPLERRETLTGGFSPGDGRRGLRHIRDHLYVYRFPRSLPLIYKPPFAGRFFEAARIRSLHATLDRLGTDRPILYLLHPKFNRYVGRLREKLVVYHVLDEYTGYLGANREKLAAEEETLLHRADLTICASRLLEATKRRTNRSAYFVPNGVDFDHFSGRQGMPVTVPADVRNIPRPRVGYIGRICDKLDFLLLLDVAKGLPGHSFCFAGQAMVVKRENRVVFEEWSNLPNVYLLGNKKPDELPAYLRAFDVAVMPYVVSDDTRQRYPLKLHEYFAAGKPVVSVPLPCLDEFDGLVRTAGRSDEWRRALGESVKENDRRFDEMRRETAMRHDWNRVVIRIEKLIGESLDREGWARPAASEEE